MTKAGVKVISISFFIVGIFIWVWMKFISKTMRNKKYITY